ncbi:hypothetical protein J5N97_018476 [Dioscorea zingiberensis]|uniref:Uncharacterized protein n=1 Tax=Dioscorea zingiberensis TaxID=325984 RepID=A0A9D5HBR1_9LILI|nr:hypothetical protein J5N97_018476 [Dioscorea zingiberensis]
MHNRSISNQILVEAKAGFISKFRITLMHKAKHRHLVLVALAQTYASETMGWVSRSSPDRQAKLGKATNFTMMKNSRGGWRKALNPD